MLRNIAIGSLFAILAVGGFGLSSSAQGHPPGPFRLGACVQADGRLMKVLEVEGDWVRTQGEGSRPLWINTAVVKEAQLEMTGCR